MPADRPVILSYATKHKASLTFPVLATCGERSVSDFLTGVVPDDALAPAPTSPPRASRQSSQGHLSSAAIQHLILERVPPDASPDAPPVSHNRTPSTEHSSSHRQPFHKPIPNKHLNHDSPRDDALTPLASQNRTPSTENLPHEIPKAKHFSSHRKPFPNPLPNRCLNTITKWEARPVARHNDSTCVNSIHRNAAVATRAAVPPTQGRRSVFRC